MIALIAALGNRRVIGIDNHLPWRIPADLRRFQELTTGHTVVMGRKTMESIGRPLPGRENIVLSQSLKTALSGYTLMRDVDEVLTIAKTRLVWIIGGESVYRAFLPHADRLYLTQIMADFDGDAYFPDYTADDWRPVSQIPGTTDPDNPYSHEFLIYERR